MVLSVVVIMLLNAVEEERTTGSRADPQQEARCFASG